MDFYLDTQLKQTLKHFRLLNQRYVHFSCLIKGSWTNLSTTFCVSFFHEEYFSCYVFLTDQTSLSGCLYFLRYWANMCIEVICYQAFVVITFEINHCFFIKPFFCITKKSGLNFKYLKNDKRNSSVQHFHQHPF